jgi:L-ascorbate metabolism protein UlaG (beta-lactamase superfamily)
MQIAGKHLLVDPVLSGHASPFSWTVKAFKGANPYSTADIADIDFLFITHDHWDHLDYKAIMDLQPRIRHIVCGLGVAAHLEHWGFDPAIITELDWYEQADLGSGFVVNALPARHFSGRGFSRNKSLWVSYALQAPSLRLFLGGDSGYDTHFAQIGSKFGPFDLAILEAGQYDPRWQDIHMLPEQFMSAAHEINARHIFPVHNSKFALSAHPWDEPLTRLTEYNKEHQLPLITPMIGEKVDLTNPNQTFSNWWEGLK